MALPRCAAAPAGDRGGTDYLDELNDTAIERAVVGALLLATPAVADRILDTVRDDDFADPRCRFVVSTARRMVSKGIPVDTLTVAGYVRSHALLAPGLARQHLGSELHDLAKSAPVPSSGPWYADAVVEQSARRRLAQAGHLLARLAIGADLNELPGAARAEMLAVVEALERCGDGAGDL